MDDEDYEIGFRLAAGIIAMSALPSPMLTACMADAPVVTVDP